MIHEHLVGMFLLMFLFSSGDAFITPEPQKHGDWFCPPSTQLVTCHLECHPGYVSDNGTVITHHNGNWSSSPSCVAAVALITGGGESRFLCRGDKHCPRDTVEIYGEGLNKKLPNLPDNKYKYSLELVNSNVLHKKLPNLLHERYEHSLELVNSYVLLCGGDDFNIVRSCLVLSPSQEWMSHSTTTGWRVSHMSISMTGKLHLLGGFRNGYTTEVLTPPSHQWTLSKSWKLIVPTSDACAAKIGPEVVIVTGGYNYKSLVVSYNVTSGLATRLQNLITPRRTHGCVYVRDPMTGLGKVLVAGGYSPTSSYNGRAESEIYNIMNGEWTTVGDLITSRYGLKMVVLGDNILAMGGYGRQIYGRTGGTNEVERFNLTTRQWTRTKSMLEERWGHAITGVPPGAVGIGQN